MTAFEVGHGFAFYEGPSWCSGPHRHAAFQVVVGDEVALADDAGTVHRAVALVVPPMVRHRMLVTDELRLFFVEPQCAFADRLRAHGTSEIVAAPELGGLDVGDVRRAGARPAAGLDPRLLAAMDALAAGPVPMPALAARVGLSPQRLRGLAREQLGMPLTRWRAWQRLRRAVEELRAGRPLAEAAAVSGFADQAHLTRWMREMIGLAPTAVLPVLRGSAAGGDVDRDRAGDR